MANGRKSGERRSYLKRFSSTQVKTGKGPSREMIEEYNARVNSIARGEDLPKTLNLKWKISPTNIPLVAAQARLRQMLGETPSTNFVVVEDRRMACVRLFWSRDTRTWFFLRENKVSGVVYKSINYGSRERAMACYNRPDGIAYTESVSPYDSPLLHEDHIPG